MSVVSFLRFQRGLARSKNPPVTPLIVQTGLYHTLMTSAEILGVAIKAPFGSGKTVGIGLKAFHDSREGLGVLADWRVIMLSTRELIRGDDFFREFVKGGSERILCGGLLTLAMWYVANRYETCMNESDTKCYTTLSKKEARGLGKIFAETEEGRRVLKMPGLSDLAEVLRQARRVVSRNILVIVDEIEGFMSEVSGVTAGDIVYSNIAMMGALYDQNVMNARLLVLGQSKVLDREWDNITRSINERVPYYSPERRAGVGSQRGTLYRCSTARNEFIDVSALEGRVILEHLRYYPGEVYADYAMLAFSRLALQAGGASGIDANVINLAENYANQLHDLIERNRISRRLSFLGSIAPRIAFDIMDEIIASMIASRANDVNEALQEALNDVASKWRTAQGAYQFYSALIISRLPGSKKVTVYSMINQRHYPTIVERLARDVFAQVYGNGCRLYTIAGKYHSNHIALATCLARDIAHAGILILRTTTGKPSGARFESNLKKHLERLLSASLESATANLPRRPRSMLKVKINAIMLVPEATQELATVMLQQALPVILSSLRVRVKSASNVTSYYETQPRVHRLNDEDFIIIAAHNLSPGSSSNIMDQFIRERYQDIIAEIAKYAV